MTQITLKLEDSLVESIGAEQIEGLVQEWLYQYTENKHSKKPPMNFSPRAINPTKYHHLAYWQKRQAAQTPILPRVQADFYKPS